MGWLDATLKVGTRKCRRLPRAIIDPGSELTSSAVLGGTVIVEVDMPARMLGKQLADRVYGYC
jgi:hypothetical protein